MTLRQDCWIEPGPQRRVHAVVAGTGPDVVFFPGNAGSVADIDPLIEPIAQNYRFVGIDPPGRLPTEWPDEPFHFFDDLPRLCDDVLAALSVGDHVVMGHSMGGMYALHHARRNRARVSGIVLFEGFVTLPIHYATAARDATVPRRMPEDVAADFLARFAANKRWEEERPRFKESFWPSQQAHDARPWVGELDLPILVVIGHNGQALPTDPHGWRERLGMQRVNDLTVAVIPNASHWMMFDAPGEVWAHVRPFLARVHRA